MEQFLAYLLQGKAQLKIVFPCDRICRNRKSKTDYSNKRIVYTCVAYLKILDKEIYADYLPMLSPSSINKDPLALLLSSKAHHRPIGFIRLE